MSDSGIDTEQVDVEDLRVGDLVFSTNMVKQGEIVEIDGLGRFHLDTGVVTDLFSPVRIRRRG